MVRELWSDLSLTPNDLSNFVNLLWRICKILVSSLRDKDVILNTTSTNIPEFIQALLVDILRRSGIFEVGLDDEAAEVNL